MYHDHTRFPKNETGKQTAKLSSASTFLPITYKLRILGLAQICQVNKIQTDQFPKIENIVQTQRKHVFFKAKEAIHQERRDKQQLIGRISQHATEIQRQMEVLHNQELKTLWPDHIKDIKMYYSYYYFQIIKTKKVSIL